MSAIDSIINERNRQINTEHRPIEGDDLYVNGELANAAACYARTDRDTRGGIPFGWPWLANSWKPGDRRRELVKAGALIVAEIERLDRIHT